MEMTAIRLTKAWKRWPVGHVFTDMPENQAEALMARGIAEHAAAAARSPVREAMAAGKNYITRGKRG
jgi:hypothetical protein